MRNGRSQVLEFVSNAACLRATHYREQAAQLRDMAKVEPIGRLRDQLMDIAEKYVRLAEDLLIPAPPANLNRRLPPR